MPATIFPSEVAEIVFVIILVVWALSEFVGGQLIPMIRRGGKRVQRRHESASALIEWMSVFILSLIFASKQIAILPSWTYYLGITLMLLGIVLRQWAMAVLGRYFSSILGTQKEQRVVDTGPYRFVRHPSYTGVLLLQIGIGLSLLSWGAVIVIFLLFGIAFGYRIRVEEKILISELGDSYISYMRRTKKRLIPFMV
jgi:protein-S-isoprenylcysteine O-methyltransferase Ste14